MELVWQPSQPSIEAAHALLEARAQGLRALGLTAPVLLGIEDGDPYACLDVVTDRSTYRVIVLAGAEGSGRADYDAMLFDLADAAAPLLDQTPGPGELDGVIDELIAAIPMSEAFKTQAALEATLRGPQGDDLMAGLMAATEGSNDPKLIAARADLATAQSALHGKGTPAPMRAHAGAAGSLLAGGIAFVLAFAAFVLVTITASSPMLAAGTALAVALVIFSLLASPARQLVALIRLGLVMKKINPVPAQTDDNTPEQPS